MKKEAEIEATYKNGVICGGGPTFVYATDTAAASMSHKPLHDNKRCVGAGAGTGATAGGGATTAGAVGVAAGYGSQQ